MYCQRRLCASYVPRNLGAAVTFATALIVAAVMAATGFLPRIPVAAAHADDVTISYGGLRTGWDRQEPALSPGSVKSGTFGELFSASVNGQVYAQPLVVGTTVIVATENDWIYALNATTGQIKWSQSLGTPVPTSVIKCDSTGSSLGITSTPVYDPATDNVYAVAEIVPKGDPASKPVIEVAELNLQSGVINKRIPIQGTAVNGQGNTFDAFDELQRPGLLLMNGWVYAGFSSNCDNTPYKGFVAGVNVSSGAAVLWTDEAGPADQEGGIWQSGGGLMSDGPGRIFFASGNGTAPAPGPGLFGTGNPPQTALGQSVVRLNVQPDGTLVARDFFSPADASSLNNIDGDVGSGAPVGLPFGTSRYPHLLVQAGKNGRLFLLNRDDLGGMQQGAAEGDAAVSESGPFDGQWGHPAAFGDTPNAGVADPGNDYVYYLGVPYLQTAHLRALKLTFSASGTPYFTDSGDSAATFGWGSGSPVVTSAGDDPASAIVWVIDRDVATGNGTLEAFKAIPQAPCSTSVPAACLQLLWSHPIGVATKFAVPATDSGRIYVGTGDGHVLAFGVLQSASTGQSAE